MGYLRKYLQQVGLVSTLLIGGVLGGLLAPPPSEALPPNVTLKVDNGTPVSIVITSSSTCTTTERNLGYTHCYAIKTTAVVTGAGAPINRSYRVLNAPGATARLRVGDNVGQDKFSLIGVQFVPSVTNWGSPTANKNEQHVLTITKSNQFNAPNNVANSGNYVYTIRAGGEFRAGPSQTTAPTACQGQTTTGRCDTVGDSVTYPGKGTFSPTLQNVNILRPAGSANNTQALSLTVGGPTAPIVSFDGLTNTTLGQVNPTYPSFLCDNNGATAGGACTSTITETMTVTLKGPDSFVLVNGGDVFGAHCTLAEVSDRQERQIAFLMNLVRFLDWLEQHHPNPRLRAFIDRIEAFLDTINSDTDDPPDCSAGVRNLNIAVAIAGALDQIAFATSGAVAVEPASTSTITINKILDVDCSDECSNLTFNFRIINESTEEETIHEVETGGNGTGSTVVPVDAGTYSIEEFSNPSNWHFGGITCGSGGNPSTGIVVPAGGNVTCTVTNNFD